MIHDLRNLSATLFLCLIPAISFAAEPLKPGLIGSAYPLNPAIP